MQNHDVSVKTFYMEDSLGNLQTEALLMGPITEERHLLNELIRNCAQKMRNTHDFKIILESHPIIETKRVE